MVTNLQVAALTRPSLAIHNNALTPGSCAPNLVAQQTGMVPNNTPLPTPLTTYITVATVFANVQYYTPSHVLVVKPSVRKGDYLSATLDDKLHNIGLQEHEHTLSGRMLFNSGLKTMPSDDQLKAAMNFAWELKCSWRLIPIGKGYFNVHADNIIERNKILYKHSWSTEYGTMHLQQWILDFNP